MYIKYFVYSKILHPSRIVCDSEHKASLDLDKTSVRPYFML